MRAVEGSLGHPLPILERGIKEREEKYSLTIPCTRATRGFRRPSLDARTLGTRQVTPPITEKEEEEEADGQSFVLVESSR